MNSNNQPCPTYPWCTGHRPAATDEDRDIHTGVIATLRAGDTTLNVPIAVDVCVDDRTSETTFGAQLGDWDLEAGRVVERVRDLRIIANKLEALLTTWKPQNAAVAL